MTRKMRILAALAALPVLAGSDDCPISVSNSDTTGTTGEASGEELDIGGQSGAYWQVRFASELQITLRDGSQTATASTTTGGGPVSLLSGTVSPGGLCAWSRAICPHQVLPVSTAILQPASSPGRALVGFNRSGPLAVLQDKVGLEGQLSGTELVVPLATAALAAAQGDPCALQAGSLIRATASAPAGSRRADSLGGWVILVFASDCLNLSGSSALSTGATLELAAALTAQRVK